MDKAQAIHEFWNCFGIPAYDETTVPDDAQLPYITYNVMTDKLDRIMNLHGSIWYKGYSWEAITKKVDEIAHTLADDGFFIQTLDHGHVWYQQGVPFAQRMTDTDDAIRRIYVNVQAEFLTRN